MLLIEFSRVEVNERNSHSVQAFVLDRPRAGAHSEVTNVVVSGRLQASGVPVVAVELTYEGRVIRRSPVSDDRGDETHELGPDNAMSGRFQMSVPTFPLCTGLHLSAELADRHRIPLAALYARPVWRHGPVAECPTVSIVIPCYNQARYLGEAIESALSQTHPNVEVIVVDDGSTDGTEAVASQYPGLRCIRQRNQGRSQARNSGMGASTGEYVVFLDADDRLLPRAVESGLGCFAARPESAFVVGGFHYISAGGRRLGPWLNVHPERDLYPELLSRNWIATHSAVMFRRQAVELVGGHDRSMEPCEDYDLYLRLARRFPAACHHEVVSEYRQHGASTSRNAAIMLAAALSAVDAQRPLVGRNTWYHRAIEAGVHAWRRYYGQQVMEDVAERMANGEWQEAAKDMAVLLRYYPHGFKESLKSVAQALPSLLSQRGRDAGAMLPGPSAPLVVRSLSPAQTAAGVGFNLQPSGLSGLAIEAEHANPWTVAIMGTTPLRTVYNSASSLSVLVPPELLEHAGSYQIYLEDGGRVSKPLEFTVKSFGVPVLTGLRPAGTRAGIGFNIQPDGQSALAVEADSAAPDTLILFGETPLVTTYHDPSFLTALVPPALYAHPGTYPVSLHNQSGSSQPIHFTVEVR